MIGTIAAIVIGVLGFTMGVPIEAAIAAVVIGTILEFSIKGSRKSAQK